ncbi:Ig-like domain-containing protein [Variovorax sp. J22R24]|uniref:Ig-like domain-containing protein n=1 Tax=Variovorax gracilis TaxID=3053502 RepID=UPI00257791C5|nr:Ig-like domain-containing protein [Variovorax sp. J22R24]MDM0106155.1 Ig-like domain-containing protein [Variovorax sp. J22R24]
MAKKKTALAINKHGKKPGDAIALDSAAPLKIKALPNVKYLLKVESGVAPEEASLVRVGNDLHVILEGDSTPALVLEGYFDLADPSGLYGVAENGQLYAYGRTDGGDIFALADGEMAPVALAGNPVPPGPVGEDDGFAFWPLLLGAAALAGLIAVARDDGSVNPVPPDPEKPEPLPSLKPVTRGVDRAIDDVGPVTGDIPAGGSTDDAQPTFVGTGTPDNVIHIYDHGRLIGSTQVDGGGNWRLTPNVPLTEGPHSITTTETDREDVSNISDPSRPLEFEVDLTAPSALAKLVSITEDTGTSASDFETNDASLVLGIAVEGDLGADERVQVSLDGGATWLDATRDAGGLWSYDNTGVDLAEGEHAIQTRVIDAVGNPGVASSQTVKIDTTPPIEGNEIAITAYGDNVAPQEGDFGSGTSTNDTSPLLKGSVAGLQDGDVVHVYEGTRLLGQAIVSGGSWSLQLTGVSPGLHSYTAVIVDAAGNKGTISNEFNLTVDLTAPPPLDALSLLDDVGDKVGLIARGDLTDDSQPTFSGKADATAVKYVVVYDNGVLLGSTEVRADGTWSFDPAAALSSGAHNFTAKPVDAAGNVGPETTPGWNFTLAGEAPPAPAITRVESDDGSVTGPLAKGDSTNDTTPVISGTGTIGTTVTVFVDDVPAGSAVVQGDGRWTVTVNPPLSGDGTKNITAQAEDGAGQKSPKTGEYPIVLDTSAPATPTLQALDDQGGVTGPIGSGSVTDDDLPALSGTGEAGATVSVYDGTTLLGTATVQGDNTWTLSLSSPLAQGGHSLTAKQTDKAGNASGSSDPLAFEVNRDPVIVSVTRADDDYGSKTGPIANGGVTDDETPTLVGQATPGAVVTIKEGQAVLGSATADSTTGNWSFALPVQAPGAHTYTVVAKNLAGTEGSAEFRLEIDRTAPSVPEIDKVVDDVGLVKGPLTSGDTTDDTTPTVSGRGATPGDTVKVYDDGKLLGSTQVKDDGTWEYTPLSELTPGEHRLTVTATDPVGNESGPSQPWLLTVDVTAPSALAKLVSITEDTGTSASDFETNDASLVLGIAVEGDLGADERVQVSLDGGATWLDATRDAGGLWSYDNTGVDLAEGEHAIQTRVIDAAGNPGVASSQTVVIDTTPPVEGNEIAITAYGDNVAPEEGDFGNGTSTNDAGGGRSRWDVAIESLRELLDGYERSYSTDTEFQVNLVFFDEELYRPYATLDSLEAAANFLASAAPGHGGTYYEPPMDKAQELIQASMNRHPDWDQKVYFLTDGKPQDDGVPQSWKDFVKTNKDAIDVYGVAYGSEVAGDPTARDRIKAALHLEEGSGDKYIEVKNPQDLRDELEDTLPTIEGNLFAAGVGLDGDGGFSLSNKVVFKGQDYVFVGDEPVTIPVVAGLTMKLYRDGNYKLTSSLHEPNVNVEMTFDVTDQDGDTATIVQKLHFGLPQAAPATVQATLEDAAALALAPDAPVEAHPLADEAVQAADDGAGWTLSGIHDAYGGVDGIGIALGGFDRAGDDTVAIAAIAGDHPERVDGGAGIDTLVLDGEAMHIDLSALDGSDGEVDLHGGDAGDAGGDWSSTGAARVDGVNYVYTNVAGTGELLVQDKVHATIL